MPDLELARGEATALDRFSASGRVPAVWGYEPSAGALLLEAISREDPLSEGAQPATVTDIAALASALHAAANTSIGDGVVTLKDRVEFVFEHWIERYQQRPDVTDTVPIAALRRGQQLARRLAASQDDIVLLHGDLHPANVLNGDRMRGLVAIDPRACVGEPAFDLVDWVFWNVETHDWKARSKDLSRLLGFDQERLWTWCSAFAAMLAASIVRRGGNQERVEALMRLAA